MEDRDGLKRAAAERALDFVENAWSRLGTGSTAAFFVGAFAARIAQGLAIVAIPTSERTAAQARQLAYRWRASRARRIDVAIDGADEVQRTTLDLVKGRGACCARRSSPRPAAGSSSS